jgi:ferric-chelate reductase
MASPAPLSTDGVDFSNETQAANFLQDLLDDSVFQIGANAVARKFWYGVVAVVGFTAICHIIWTVILRARYLHLKVLIHESIQLIRDRLRASHANRTRPAQANNPLTKALAALTGVVRMVSYLQITPETRSSWFKIPPFGTICVIVAYGLFVLCLQFINDDVPGPQWYTAVGIRAGWLAVAQVPLLVLLAGKHNLIGFLSGMSYERLNVYHRWVARGLLLLSTFHFGFFGYSWTKYGVMKLEWATDTAPPPGMAAYALLLWMNLSTLAPLRNWCYEFFVVQHVITFFGFIIAIMLHLPGSAKYSRVYIYIPIALYLVEKLISMVHYLFNNIRPSRATLEALDGGATRIRVSSRQIKTWVPGTHVELSIPGLGVSHHPATILSIPGSHNGDLVFILRAYEGATKRLLRAAPEGPHSSASSSAEVEQGKSAPPQSYLALIGGPYGSSHKDFACFDTVVLIAGATGVTFTMSVLLDLAKRAAAQERGRRLPLRAVHFVWVIQKRSWQSWISDELQSAGAELARSGIEFSARIYVTRDEFSEPATCRCEGECTCRVTDPDAIGPDEAKRIEPTTEKVSAKVGSTQSPSLELQTGRPIFDTAFWDVLSRAEGESAVGVCGPLSLSTAVRRAVVKISNGRSERGIYLHVESFS